jgi:hypothetical protein
MARLACGHVPLPPDAFLEGRGLMFDVARRYSRAVRTAEVPRPLVVPQVEVDIAQLTLRYDGNNR